MLTLCRFSATRLSMHGRHSALAAHRTIQLNNNTIPQIRHMSMFGDLKDKVTEKIEARKQGKEADLYKEQIQKMINMESFTMLEFRKQLEDMAAQSGATGWKTHIPGVSGHAQVEEIKKNLAVLRNMTDEELLYPKQLKGPGKRRVAALSMSTVQQVNGLIKQYEMMAVMHGWLRRRHLDGFPAPSSMVEVQELMTVDRRGIPNKKMGIKRRR